MFARNVSIHLKSNMLSDYTRTFEKDVLPLLRKQNGFKDEITLSNPGSLDVVAISLWESKTNAEAYNTNTYPEVLKTFGTEGNPKSLSTKPLQEWSMERPRFRRLSPSPRPSITLL
jgi:hypothetical protein